MKRYSAKQVPLQHGPSGWNALLGPWPESRTLEGNMTADFVVVGAGFAGLSAARRLTQIAPDAKIVVLEAGRLAEGAAGRNSGFLTDLPQNLSGADQLSSHGDGQLIALYRQAQAFAGDAVQDYEIKRDFFERAGKIDGAADFRTERAIYLEAAHLEALGEPFEMLDGKAMYEMTGSHYYYSGLYTPGTVMLQPAGYIRGLAEGLWRDDVSIFEDSAVSALEREASDWSVVTSKGRVSAGKVIVADYEQLNGFEPAQDRLIKMFSFGAMTSEMSRDQVYMLGGEDRWGITPADPMGVTVRRIDTGQGGNRMVIQTSAALRSDLTARKSDLARAEALLRKKFEDRFPRLTSLKLELCWTSHLCLSRTGVVALQEVDDGVFSAGVQTGLGTTHETLTGIAAADLACGQRSAMVDYFIDQPQPKQLISAPLRDMSGNAALRWKEWRARNA